MTRVQALVPAFIVFLASAAYAQPATEVRFIKVPTENLRKEPDGQKMGELEMATPLTVVSEHGEWLKVKVEGWIWKDSTSTDPVEKNVAIEKRAGPDLELTDFSVTNLPVNYDASRFQPKVRLTLHLKNNTTKRIKAWKAKVEIKNAFGDSLLNGELTDGTADISSGGTSEASFAWEDNPFIKDEPYDKLTSYSKENLRLEIVETKLIQ